METATNSAASQHFKDAVCIDAGRIYDSCSDKECLEDLRVFFTDCTQREVNDAISVKPRDVKLLTAYLDIEEVPFNRGYYTVDITFFFEEKLDLITLPSSCNKTVKGLCVYNKKVVLYGSEGSVKIFSSDYIPEDDDRQLRPARNLPKAICQVAEPVLLGAKLTDCPIESDCCGCKIPHGISEGFEGEFLNQSNNDDKYCYCTIGLFTICQIERNVQMLVPVYDFCIPDKPCTCSDDTPCDLFRKIKFPTDQFFPPDQCEKHCGACGD